MGEYSCQNQTISSAVRLDHTPGQLCVCLFTAAVGTLPIYHSLPKYIEARLLEVIWSFIFTESTEIPVS